jgi:glycosyltransferase involved in cell wall biosynthesis
MKPLRVLHVAVYYEDAWAYGGIPRVVAALCRALANQKQHVTVCTTDVYDSKRRLQRTKFTNFQSSQNGITSHGVDVRIFPNISNWLAYEQQLFVPIGFYSYLLKHIASFDIIHIHGHHHLMSVTAAKLAVRAGVPYIVTPNGTAPRIERRRFGKWLFDIIFGQDRALRNAKRVTAVSHAEKRTLIGMGIPEHQICILPNPVDLSEFDPRPAGKDFKSQYHIPFEKMVLYLGKLTPRKNIDLLIRSMAEIPQQSVGLVIAGYDYGMKKSLQALVRKCSLESRVIFSGGLQGKARLEALAAADVVAYPGHDEVFGLVAFESILCGTPVVVAGDSGCGEIVQNAGGGIVVPKENVSAISEALRAILDAQSIWDTKIKPAQEYIEENFSDEVVGRQLTKIYEDVIGKP